MCTMFLRMHTYICAFCLARGVFLVVLVVACDVVIVGGGGVGVGVDVGGGGVVVVVAVAFVACDGSGTGPSLPYHPCVRSVRVRLHGPHTVRCFGATRHPPTHPPSLPPSHPKLL